jgi:hypothetical protein
MSEEHTLAILLAFIAAVPTTILAVAFLVRAVRWDGRNGHNGERK